VIVAVVVVLVAVLLAASAKIAGEFQRVLIFRLGRLQPQAKGPGLFLTIPLVDRLVRVDLTQQTLSEAVGAHRFVGSQVVAEDDDRVRLNGMPWPARSEDGSPLVPGATLRVEAVEDDLRLVVGSA
jgi:regulator of protease activity HflC (stomatin/prohibitin superfamily)